MKKMKNKIKYTDEFNKYWENYGELHASFCNGDIKLFAFEIWQSAKENAKSNKNP